MPLRAVARSCRTIQQRGRRRSPVLVLAALGLCAPTASASATEPTGGASPVFPAVTSPPAGVIAAEIRKQKVFFGARRPAELSYVVAGSEPAEVHVELVRTRDEATIAEWTRGGVEPGVVQTIRWNGIAGGKLQKDGVYAFRVTAPGAVAASNQGPAVPEPPSAFTFLRHRFPVAGAHRYGKGAATFGGGRGHQGHDVFAACGTPIVAARGGVVQFKQYQSAAGHYVVIDGARTSVDFAYMHLREAALVDAGDRVKTGQLIGFVGATGRASGCHLHFEQWTAPGWYSGGRPFDPLPDLRTWDAHS